MVALVEVRGVLDLVLGHPDVDKLGVGVDPLDHAGGDQALLAEDPRPGVDHDVGGSGLVGRFVDLADAAIGRFDLVAHEVTLTRGEVVSVCPR